MEKEIWKPVDKFEGFYEVSNLGRIRSIKRYYRSPQNGKLLLVRDRIMCSNKIWNGYLKLKLSFKGNNYDELVHRLVAEAFIENPYNYSHVNHKNETKDDNRSCNLQWVTPRENNNYSRNIDKITSVYPGVCWSKKGKKWQASINFKGKNKWLGYHKKEEDAAKAYTDFCKENNLAY